MAVKSVFRFGALHIPASQVFWEGTWTYALVNLRPVTPGHVLVVPKRIVLRFVDLTASELQELMDAATRISTRIARGRSTIAVQDGADAGQSIPHLHVHVVPYTGEPLSPDMCREDRSNEDMATEADRYRALMTP